MRTTVLAIAVVLAASSPATATKPVHYHLSATLDPAAHRIIVGGTMRGPDGKDKPVSVNKVIHHPIAATGEDYARGFAETPGTIQAEGVFLSGASGWYPKSGDALLTFDLEVTLPAGWIAMSQGRPTLLGGTKGNHVRFDQTDPQEEIWLVAGPWKETARTVDGIVTASLLREQDDALSGKYLDATATYVAMYSKLLGPYPYAKFALVENFWETGYGMPGFTLLGSKVIRLPFIITSSYPHEILHNWFGNGIYVDSKSGNWSEGLTAYLADHMFAEQNGNGAAYRQEALQKYADYAARSKDFPLSAFRERHSPSTEAVGYGKALMLFHMIRRETGDAAFVKGLRALYQEKKFQRASFDDVNRALAAASGKSLDAFGPWVTRAGAPRLRAKGVTAEHHGDEWRVTGNIEQTQAEAPYVLAIPIALTLEGKDAATQTVVRTTGKDTTFVISSRERPLRLDVDPEFDLFRVLDVEEAPPALSGAFGAEACTMILPAAVNPEVLTAYHNMGEDWNTGRPAPMKIVTDAEITELPKDGSVWIAGFENKFAPAAKEAIAPYGATMERSRDRAIVRVARRRKGSPDVIAFIAAARAPQIPGLARKLPHYHKYSYLGFEGDEPLNVEKGRWPVTDSPMTALFAPGDVPMGKLASREPLAELPPAFSKERMLATVSALAAPEMKGRGLKTPELDRAADKIASAMKDAGLEVLPADPEMKNVIGVLRGTKTEWAESSVVVGAHYDHLGTPQDATTFPGADDNASGVAVLLELARQMGAAGRPSRTVIFAAFTGEEAGLLGSKRYVAAPSSWPAKKAIGMVNLDTVGRLGSGKILVLGSNSADEWIHIVNGAGYVTGAPVTAVMDDPGGSDQKSFIEAGVPAVQIFTGANADYHKPTDTADKIDGAGLVKVAAVTRELVAYLAERPNPLTSKIKGAAPTGAPPSSGERRASLGSIPDYAFPGPGVRITGTTPGSPAEKAGLKEGDVITKIGDNEVSGMREFSEALKKLAPGDKVAVQVLREGKPVTVEATLAAR